MICSNCGIVAASLTATATPPGNLCARCLAALSAHMLDPGNTPTPIGAMYPGRLNSGPFLTTAQVLEQTGVPLAEYRAAVLHGDLPLHMPGSAGEWLHLRSDVSAWLDARGA